MSHEPGSIVLTPSAGPIHSNLVRKTGKQLRVGAVNSGVQHPLGKSLQAEALEAALVADGAVEVRLEVSGVDSLNILII